MLSALFPSSQLLGLVVGVSLLILPLLLYRNIRKATTLVVPKGFTPIPGPEGHPIFGQSFQVPVDKPQTLFMKWAKEYGEVFQIQLGFQRWIFLNSGSAVKEIIEKQSGVTSSRPSLIMADLVSGYRRMLLMPYGGKWRNLRAIIHSMFTPKASATFKPSQEFEATQLLADLYQTKEDETAFYQLVRRYTTSVVLTSTYGFRVPSWDCEEVREIYGLMSEFNEVASPVYSMVDMFPILLKLPNCLHWWTKDALKKRTRQDRIWMRFWNDMKEKISRGQAPECFGRQFVEAGYRSKGIDELQAAYVAGTMIEAGSETTSGTFNTTILYLIANPDVVRTAQEELAQVIGDLRSPTYDDEERLPYIRAIVKEVLRIRPISPVGSPHYTTADVTYKDYFIPKNTVVTIYQYGIQRDPQRWTDPEKFDPSRYLSYPLKSGVYAGQTDPQKRDHYSFGGGRRICPGMHLAENSLFILTAKVLWAFTPKAALGSDGKQMKVDTSDDAYESGTTTIPKRFRCRLIPRNQAVVATLQQEWEIAKKNGFLLGDRRVDANGIVVAKI